MRLWSHKHTATLLTKGLVRSFCSTGWLLGRVGGLVKSLQGWGRCEGFWCRVIYSSLCSRRHWGCGIYSAVVELLCATLPCHVHVCGMCYLLFRICFLHMHTYFKALCTGVYVCSSALELQRQALRKLLCAVSCPFNEVSQDFVDNKTECREGSSVYALVCSFSITDHTISQQSSWRNVSLT